MWANMQRRSREGQRSISRCGNSHHHHHHHLTTAATSQHEIALARERASKQQRDSLMSSSSSMAHEENEEEAKVYVCTWLHRVGSVVAARSFALQSRCARSTRPPRALASLDASSGQRATNE